MKNKSLVIFVCIILISSLTLISAGVVTDINSKTLTITDNKYTNFTLSSDINQIQHYLNKNETICTITCSLVDKLCVPKPNPLCVPKQHPVTKDIIPCDIIPCEEKCVKSCVENPIKVSLNLTSRTLGLDSWFSKSSIFKNTKEGLVYGYDEKFFGIKLISDLTSIKGTQVCFGKEYANQNINVCDDYDYTKELCSGKWEMSMKSFDVNGCFIPLHFSAYTNASDTPPTHANFYPPTASYYTNFGNISLNYTLTDPEANTMYSEIYVRNSSDSFDAKNNIVSREVGLEDNSAIAYNITALPFPYDSQADGKGMLMWFHFDNLSWADENYYKFREMSGMGMNGTYFDRTLSQLNSTTYQQGKLGMAINNTANSYSFISNYSTDATSNKELSFAMWVNPETLDNYGFFLGKTSGNSWANGWGVYMNGIRTDFWVEHYTSNVAYTQNNEIVKGKWNFLVGVWNGSAISIYVNGVVGTNDTYSGSLTDLGANVRIGSTYDGYGIKGLFDEIAIWNRTLTSQEIWDMYNIRNDTYTWKVNVTDSGGSQNESSDRTFQIGGSPTGANQYPNVTFDSQIPNDITSLNVVANPMNISYNITNDGDGNNNTYYLYTKVNSTTREGLIFINGSNNILWDEDAYNYLAVAQNKYTWILEDNEIYPATYNLDDDTTDVEVHTRQQLTTTGHYIAMQLLNVTNTTQYNFYEIMSNSSGIQRLYYCNSTFTTNTNPSTANYCSAMTSIPIGQDYNHTHTINSKHQEVPFVINETTGKTLGGTIITSTSWFVLRGNSVDAVNYYTVSNVSRVDAVKLTTNNGATWSNQAFTLDAHLHQFSGNSSLYYYACANDTINQKNCSSVRSDNFDLGGLPPSVSISAPISKVYKGVFTINYSTASPNGYAIVNKTIYLTNEGFAYNYTIKDNETANTYLFDSSLVQDAEYRVEVIATDDIGQKGYAFSTNFSISNIVAKGCMGMTTNFSCGENITESCSLNGNLSSNGNCFRVYDNNVVVDLNKYNISGNSLGNGMEIYGDNVSVINGSIEYFNTPLYSFSADNLTLFKLLLNNYAEFGYYSEGGNNINFSSNKVIDGLDSAVNFKICNYVNVENLFVNNSLGDAIYVRGQYFNATNIWAENSFRIIEYNHNVSFSRVINATGINCINSGLSMTDEGVWNYIENASMVNCSGVDVQGEYSHVKNMYVNNIIGDAPNTLSFTMMGNHSLLENAVIVGGWEMALISNSYNNTMLNVTYDNSNDYVFGDFHSSAFRKWYYRAYVNDSAGDPVKNANVTAYDVNGDYAFELTTDGTGYTSQTIITEYEVTNNSLGDYLPLYNNYYPYNILAFNTSYAEVSKSFSPTTNNYKHNFQLLVTAFNEFLIKIVFPTNTTYPYPTTTMNTIFEGINFLSCKYSHNGATNVSFTCGQNVSGIPSGDGSHNLFAYVTNIFGITNYTSVWYSIDTSVPITPSGTTTATCRYKKFQYYNLNLPFFREEGCL